jgi:hypothetical protein
MRWCGRDCEDKERMSRHGFPKVKNVPPMPNVKPPKQENDSDLPDIDGYVVIPPDEFHRLKRQDEKIRNLIKELELDAPHDMMCSYMVIDLLRSACE